MILLPIFTENIFSKKDIAIQYEMKNRVPESTPLDKFDSTLLPYFNHHIIKTPISEYRNKNSNSVEVISEKLILSFKFQQDFVQIQGVSQKRIMFVGMSYIFFSFENVFSMTLL